MILASLILAAQLSDEITKKIDEVFAQWNTTSSPGCAIGIMRDDQLVFARGYGMADLERRVAITPRTVFPIQSTSKQFVAMSVALLVRDGKLSFDDDVRRYIPELPDYGATITIRHLLEHSSGLRDIGILTQDQGWHPEAVLSRAHIMRLITRQKALNHAPGAAASYTNTGYFLLALIIERVAGEPAAAFMKTRIFDPLGMIHTRYREDAAALVADRAVGYSRQGDGPWRLAGNSHAAVFTTVEDLALWSANFDRATVGGPEVIRWMTTWGKLTTGETTEWGLGLSPIHYRGLDGIYFSGGGNDGTSVLTRFPQEKFAFSILCNGSIVFNAETLAPKVIDAVLASEIAAVKAKPQETPADPAAVEVPLAQLRSYQGLYFTTQNGPWTREFREREGKLRVVLSPELSRDLIPLGGGRFHAANSSADYVFEGHRVRRITAKEPVVTFERVDETRPASLGEFAGTFYNDEVEASVVFTVRDGALWYAMPRDETPDKLEPMFRDAFSDGPLVFRFLRDAAGRVTGVDKHWDRVWSLRYVVPKRRQAAGSPN